MAAPKKNQFWKNRAKHGRDKLFKTPKLLWDAACEYFEWCDSNPHIEKKPMVVSMGSGMGSEVEMTEIPVDRAYTLHGLCIYLGCSTSYFRTFKSVLKKEDEDFLAVIEQIEEVIYEQKFSGAASGFFNANIIARDLGLKDSSDITTKGESLNKSIDLSKLSDKELKDLEKLTSKLSDKG